MSDEKKHNAVRRPTSDPRFEAEETQASGVAVAARWAGWAAGLGALVFLLWFAVTRTFNLGPQIVLGVTAALAVFYLSVHWRSLVAAGRTRRARLGTSSVVFVLFVLGILVLVNIIVARRPYIRKDLTEDRRFSLSQQTEQVIRGLDKEVTIVAFTDPGSTLQQQMQHEELMSRLREYNMLSPKLEVTTYDPRLDGDKVKEYDVMSVPTLIVKSGEREEKVLGGSEEQLTSTILAVTTGKKTKVYFLQGHGERSPEEPGPRGMGSFKANLENQQYEVETLELYTEEEPKVPGDCAVLVIAGPTEPIGEKEMQALIDYQNQNGNLLVMLEPSGPDLSELLSPYGIKPYDGMVVDPQRGYFRAAYIPTATNFADHPTTRGLEQFQTALATARGLEIVDTSQQDPMTPGMPPMQNAVTLFETSGAAWVETTPDEGMSQDPDEPSGRIALAAAVDTASTPPQMPGMPEPPQQEEGMRMVVVGDGDLVTEEILNLGPTGNLYFAINSVNWLAANEKLISIPPREDTPRYVTMNSTQQKLVWVITVAVVPLLIAIAGFTVWYRRR